MKPRAVRYGKATWARFMAACKAAGVTAAGIAGELSCSRQYLVNAATRPKHSLSLLRAKEIERLTGFPVSGWPRVTQPKPIKEGLVYSGTRPKLSAGPTPPAAPASATERKKKPKEAGILH